MVVEDCVAIGRAFGGGVASVLSRPEEPITFRRCCLWALDEWGDTSGAYVRVENEAMPEVPDALFEDCSLVGPQCSLKAGNYGFHTYTRVRMEGCRLVTLNFSQPHGTPTDGIIQSVQNGKYLHAELKDCTLMGFKVFGVKVDKDSAKDIGYTVSGATQAYVQFTQRVPKGFHRLGHWPVEVFNSILPPMPERRILPSAAKPQPSASLRAERSNLGQGDGSEIAASFGDSLLAMTDSGGVSEVVSEDMCELSPFEWQGKLHHMECHRPGRGGKLEDYFLLIRDAETGEELARFAQGHGLASIHVQDGKVYAFASRWEERNWNDVTLFKSSDLEHWEKKVVIQQEKEHLFNSSVCAGPDGFVMAYESNGGPYPAFTTKFARSDDLETWTKLPDSTFGTDRYTACPCVRYSEGYYYVLYLERRPPRHYFETYATRSKDLKAWELARSNPVLAPAEIDDGINASDPDIIEFGGKTFVYYAVGDQLTWMNIKRAQYAGGMDALFAQWFRAGAVPDLGTVSSAKR